jgi:hypothetical protein
MGGGGDDAWAQQLYRFQLDVRTVNEAIDAGDKQCALVVKQVGDARLKGAAETIQGVRDCP